MTAPHIQPAIFSSSLISSEVAASFPDGYKIRPLERHDFAKGYLECLRVLTWVGHLKEDEWFERYDEMVKCQGTYYLLALEHQGRIVGTGSLIVEKKL